MSCPVETSALEPTIINEEGGKDTLDFPTINNMIQAQLVYCTGCVVGELLSIGVKTLHCQKRVEPRQKVV